MLLQLAVRLLPVPSPSWLVIVERGPKVRNQRSWGAEAPVDDHHQQAAMIAMIMELRPITSNKIITQMVGPALREWWKEAAGGLGPGSGGIDRSMDRL